MELIALMKTTYGVTLQENDITRLGIRTQLEDSGISSKKASTDNKKRIIEEIIEHVKKNNIAIKTIANLHREALHFGEISRATLDNNLAYIQKHIEIKNLKDRKRSKALDMTDQEVIIETAKKYVRKVARKKILTNQYQ